MEEASKGRGVSSLLEKGHKETKTDEDHDMDVLELDISIYNIYYNN